MPTTAAAKTAKTAKPKAAATKTAKAAPAKKAAAKKATRAAKPKAAPVAPEAAAVAAFVEAYRAEYRSRAGFDKDYVSPEPWRAARVKLCKLAGCHEPESMHRLEFCKVGAEITGLMTAVQRAQYAAFCPDRTGEAAAVLTYRLTERAA